MIPNDLLDALCRSVEMKNAERCVLLYLIRQSYGFNRDHSGSFGSIGAVARATKMNRRTAARALAELKDRGVLSVTTLGDAGSSTVYKINPCDGWASGPQTPSGPQATSGPQTPRASGAQTPRASGPPTPPQKTKNKQRTNNPPRAPQADKKWTADRLFFQLGGRGTIPPFVQGKWLAISERSDEDIETALRKVRNFQVPRNRFLDLFDDEGQDLSPEWEQRARERRQGPRESTEEDRAASNARIIADFEKWKQTRN